MNLEGRRDSMVAAGHFVARMGLSAAEKRVPASAFQKGRRWMRVKSDPCFAGGCLRTAASFASSKEP